MLGTEPRFESEPAYRQIRKQISAIGGQAKSVRQDGINCPTLPR